MLLKWGVSAVLLLVLSVLYFVFDPAEHVVFPKCPFKMLTGWDCPGCGSQRAIHALLHGDVLSAFRLNALMVLAVPYLALGFAWGMVREPGEKMLKWRKRLFGERAIYVILLLIIGYTVWRNIHV